MTIERHVSALRERGSKVTTVCWIQGADVEPRQRSGGDAGGELEGILAGWVYKVITGLPRRSACLMQRDFDLSDWPHHRDLGDRSRDQYFPGFGRQDGWR